MKKKLVVLILISFFFIPCVSAEDLAPNAKSAILIEESTGKILYEKNSDEKRAPASMTKVMSMLLIMEALDNKQISLNDEVTISQNAADMGGSQLFLQPNQTAKVEDLLKGIAVASGNDAVVAMAEKIAGSEEKFVDMMNKKAKELGLKNTQFKNPHGLDEEGHYTSAHDMAIMAKELIKHKNILNYTSIYEEYLTKSDGTKLWMVNTNKLVKFYKGVDGLKTGFTQTAGYCLTATAMKNNTRLISVVMGEDTSANRSTDTVNLLNYGFNSYKVNTIIKKEKNIAKVKVNKGKEDKVYIRTKENVNELLNVNEKAKKYILVPEVKNIIAPVKVGEKVGILKIKYQNKVVKEVDLTVSKNIKKANLWDLFKRNLKMIVSGK
ncbi:MAG TPA: D-alanyl-D-alanine carboxypeptidase [Bacilli bacterium]|nr:D-alanyl-D-alanine carboxypeptidase [Bacilli bacterium]